MDATERLHRIASCRVRIRAKHVEASAWELEALAAPDSVTRDVWECAAVDARSRAHDAEAELIALSEMCGICDTRPADVIDPASARSVCATCFAALRDEERERESRF